jgi:hypothetical protein
MTELDIYRGTSIWLTIKTDDKTRLIKQILGTDIVKSSFNSHIFLDITVGDYIVYGGVIYHINSLPNIKKNSINSYDYDVTFESESYELLKTQFLDSDGNSDFYLVGNLETFIDLIVTNMNREHAGWVSLTRDQTNHDYKLLSFSKANCMQVLQKLCSEFEGEFYFEFTLDFEEGAELPYVEADSAVIGYKPAAEAEHDYKPAAGGTGIVSYIKDICFTDKAGEDSGLTFKYKSQGLRNIHKTTLTEKNIVTRLYAFGSRKNLKSDYRDYSRRLKFVLPTGESYLEKYITATTWEASNAYVLGDIVKALTSNEYYYECTTAGDSGGEEPDWGTTEGGTTPDGTVIWTCRVDPVDKYGTIEHTEIFEDIYPHRGGEISYVGAEITKFRDTNEPAMFDLNDYLLPGVTAKVHFNSGNLGGYEFEISNYNHTTKEFTMIAFKDEQGYEMPNAALKPAIGDKYVLIDIFLPQSYIDTAETALQAKAQTYLNNNCEPRVTYILEPDWRYFKEHLIELKAGDFITIEDADLGIDVMTRIVELTKSVSNEYKYTLKLTDHLEVQLIQRLYSGQEGLKEDIEIGEGGDIIRSRRNWRTSEELRSMIFDTDGYFDMGNIKPASIETGMLSVGSRSIQFILEEIEIEGNYQSDVSKFHASAGKLIHLSIAEEIQTWILFENTQDSLVDETPYYIYAKCTREPGYTGQIVVDETQRRFDDDETYYYFMIGVLHSVVDSVRGISLTYGQTIINGKFIRTGKIESTDGLTYFDLDNSTIRGKIQFIANTSGYDNISDKPDLSIYDAKATVFRQATAPTSGMQAGDIWIDTSDGDKPHTYDGSDWILMYTIIDGGNIETGTLTADKLNIDNLADIANMQLGATGYIRTTGKISYDSTIAGIWLGYSAGYKLNIGNATKYLKWDGVNLNIKGNLIITGGSGIANLTDAGALATLDDIAYAAITGAKPPVDADKTADVVSNLAYYNMVSAALLDNTIIIGGYIKTSLLTATNIRTGTLRSVRVQIGGGTNEDIYFEDSGIRMYDGSSNSIGISKSGLIGLGFYLNASYSQIRSTSTLYMGASGVFLKLYTGGSFRLINKTSAPTGYGGAIAYNSAKNRFQCYIAGAGWGYELMSAGW